MSFSSFLTSMGNPATSPSGASTSASGRPLSSASPSSLSLFGASSITIPPESATATADGSSSNSSSSSAEAEDASFVLSSSALYGGSTESCFDLSRTQRALGFVLFLVAGSFCLGLAFLYIPMLVLKARKFALLFSLGSVFLLTSFAILVGPRTHFRRLLASERLPITATYLASLLGTIYCSMVLRSTLYTVMLASCQLGVVAWYITSFVPGGLVGLKMLGRFSFSVFRKTAEKLLPM